MFTPPGTILPNLRKAVHSAQFLLHSDSFLFETVQFKAFDNNYHLVKHSILRKLCHPGILDILFKLLPGSDQSLLLSVLRGLGIQILEFNKKAVCNSDASLLRKQENIVIPVIHLYFRSRLKHVVPVHKGQEKCLKKPFPQFKLPVSGIFGTCFQNGFG